MPRKKQTDLSSEDPVAKIGADKAPGPTTAAIRREAAKPPKLTKSGRSKKMKPDPDGSLPLRQLANAPASHERSKDDPDKRSVRRARAEARGLRPFLPGNTFGKAGRPKERTFEEDARDILAHGVPVKLRAQVALRTGLPLDVCAHMSLRQAVILLLIHDAIEKGQWDRIDRILDRTDPKSRRVEHRGGVAHMHNIAPQVLGLSAEDAAEVYRKMTTGEDPGLLIEAEVIDVEED